MMLLMIVMLLIVIAILLFFIVAGQSRREVERYFERNRLPNGEKVPLGMWAMIAGATAILILIITKSYEWTFLVLIMVGGLGPFIHHAVAWQLDSTKGRKERPNTSETSESLLKFWWDAGRRKRQ